MLETNVMFRKIAIGNHKLHTLESGEIKKIHGILREMLMDFDTVCRKHGLTYFLCGGTALGAVRHGGFIEWDEDADISMPRKDYERFLHLFVSEFGDKYYVQSIHGSDKYDLTFMKIRRKKTKYIELFETDPEVAGVFMDVYPLDSVPDSKIARFFHGNISDFLYLCLSCVRIKTKKQRFLEYLDNKKAVKMIKIKSFIGALLSFFSLHRWCVIAENWSKKYKNDSSFYVSFPNGRKHYFGEMCTRSSFFPPKEITFEGLRLFVMSDPSEYLTKLYGDYMAIPPESERERHTVLELDLGDYNG